MSEEAEREEELTGSSSAEVYTTELRALKDGDFVYTLRGNDHKALLKVATEIEEGLNTLHKTRVERRTELNKQTIPTTYTPTARGRRY